MKKHLRITFEGKIYNVDVEIIEPRQRVKIMKGTRADKIRSFNIFRNKYGRRVFESFFKSKSATFFNNIYKENIAEQLKFGVRSDRFFAVFWGSRPYDSELRFFDDKGNWALPRTVLLAEKGAQLIYNRMDDGRVCVCLYRAETERENGGNDYILIDDISNPRKLLNRKILWKHWKKLLTCMENTCIEYKPGLLSRLKMFWLNIYYPYTEKDRINTRRLFSWLKKSFLFTMPILFSGIGLTIISCINQKINPPPIELEIENQEEIIKVIRNIERKSDFTYEMLKQNVETAKKIEQHDSTFIKNSEFIFKNDSMIKEIIIQSNKLLENELKELKLLRKELKK